VTRTPNLAITWVISAPIGPPPMTMRLPGPTGAVQHRRAGVGEAVHRHLVVPVGGGFLCDATGDRRPRRGHGGLPRGAVHPCGLGQQVGGAHHHLRRDAPVVGALTAHEVLVNGHDAQSCARRARREGLATGAEADDHEVALGAHAASLPAGR
jgi:hypothetical protein